MKYRILNMIVGITAMLILMGSLAIASENRQANAGSTNLTGTETKVSYRYYYPYSGCYYVKKCSRVNRWGKCVKFRWILQCGPRRVI